MWKILIVLSLIAVTLSCDFSFAEAPATCTDEANPEFVPLNISQQLLGKEVQAIDIRDGSSMLVHFTQPNSAVPEILDAKVRNGYDVLVGAIRIQRLNGLDWIQMEGRNTLVIDVKFPLCALLAGDKPRGTIVSSVLGNAGSMQDDVIGVFGSVTTPF